MTEEIVVVGSLNVDLVARAERLPRRGETIPGGDLALFPGGKGANQAHAAARLGGRVRIIGQVGCDAFAEILLRSLHDGNVDTAGIGVADRPTGTALITVLPDGENAILVSAGANATLTPDLAVARLLDLKRNSLVLLQLEVPVETVEACVALANSAGAVTILDPAPVRPLPGNLLRQVSFLTPNQAEAAALLGDDKEVGTFEQARLAARRLLELGPRAVVLKLGPLGCLVADANGSEEVAGFPVKAVDTTAAGDTFNAAFAVGLAEGLAARAAARFANAAAALSVTRAGAQASAPSREEVEAFVAQVPA